MVLFLMFLLWCFMYFYLFCCHCYIMEAINIFLIIAAAVLYSFRFMIFWLWLFSRNPTNSVCIFLLTQELSMRISFFNFQIFTLISSHSALWSYMSIFFIFLDVVEVFNFHECSVTLESPLSVTSIESLLYCGTLLIILFRSSEFVFMFHLLNVLGLRELN